MEQIKIKFLDKFIKQSGIKELHRLKKKVVLSALSYMFYCFNL